jgi:hypothetical protein
MLIGEETKSIIDDAGDRMISNSTIDKHVYNNAVTTTTQCYRSFSDVVITFTQVVFFMIITHACLFIFMFGTKRESNYLYCCINRNIG